MRLKNVPGAREAIADSEYVVKDEMTMAGKWRELFPGKQELRLEIGTGKGRFLMEMARRNPDVAFLGIEKYSSVLLRAIQKLEEEPMDNIRFIRMDAEEIVNCFAEGEVDRIYLNFSDPWPKDRHAKRRLPSSQFLARYDKILRADGVVEFKTDNRPLFDFAVEELEPAGWQADLITYDLHSREDLMVDNVMTEYEEKFSQAGNPICKYVIHR